MKVYRAAVYAFIQYHAFNSMHETRKIKARAYLRIQSTATRLFIRGLWIWEDAFAEIWEDAFAEKFISTVNYTMLHTHFLNNGTTESNSEWLIKFLISVSLWATYYSSLPLISTHMYILYQNYSFNRIFSCISKRTECIWL